MHNPEIDFIDIERRTKVADGKYHTSGSSLMSQGATLEDGYLRVVGNLEHGAEIRPRDAAQAGKLRVWLDKHFPVCRYCGRVLDGDEAQPGLCDSDDCPRFDDDEGLASHAEN